MDSVSAVISPLLGGKQTEGDLSVCCSVITPKAVFTPAAGNLWDESHGMFRRRVSSSCEREGSAQPFIQSTGSLYTPGSAGEKLLK